MPDSKITADKLDAEYMAWFEKLQSLTPHKLVPEHWVGRWYDYFSPEEALEEGPEID